MSNGRNRKAFAEAMKGVGGVLLAGAVIAAEVESAEIVRRRRLEREMDRLDHFNQLSRMTRLAGLLDDDSGPEIPPGYKLVIKRDFHGNVTEKKIVRCSWIDEL